MPSTRRALAAILPWLAFAACDAGTSPDPTNAPDTAAVDAGPDTGPDDDATALDAAPVDAGAPSDAPIPPIDAPDQVCMAPPPGQDPPVDCASQPTGDWIGTASIIAQGAGSRDGTSADVRWTLVERAGCVDRYRPSGTAREQFSIGCCCALQVEPRTSAIEEMHGELVIDRSTAPATYHVVGTSHWDGIVGCPGETHAGTIGGTWVNGRGLITGDVISGSSRNGATTHAWQFTREGASFAPPGDCSVPPREGWTTTFTRPSSNRTVTWIRTATDGCRVHYAVCGESGGRLIIDRSVNPPTFSLEDHAADVDVAGVVDGEQFGAGVGSVDWRLTMARCGSPSCFGPPPAGGVAMTDTRTGAVPDDQYQVLAPVAVVPGTRFVARLGASGSRPPDVLVGWNAPPTSASHACSVRSLYGAETCDLEVPAIATTAYVALYGWNTYDDAPTMPYTITLSWTNP